MVERDVRGRGDNPKAKDIGEVDKALCLESWQDVDPVGLASAWAAEMTEQGVDEAAQKTLFLLAQSSDRGRTAACCAMAKIFKKEANGQAIHNPSAFIHKICMKSFDALGWGVEYHTYTT